MVNSMVARLRRAAERYEAARRERDELIAEASKTHSGKMIGEAVGLSQGRVSQIISEVKKRGRGAA